MLIISFDKLSESIDFIHCSFKPNYAKNELNFSGYIISSVLIYMLSKLV